MERKQIRENIKSDARNLCEYVVKTTIEYKEELLKLEEDLLLSENENKNLERINLNLKEQNDFLTDEYVNMEYRLRTLIEKIGNKICYKCDHFLDCDRHLCVYCKQWFCSCCIRTCKKNDEIYCNLLMCSNCLSIKGSCPDHEKVKDQKLIDYYLENRYTH